MNTDSDTVQAKLFSHIHKKKSINYDFFSTYYIQIHKFIIKKKRNKLILIYLFLFCDYTDIDAMDLYI